MTTRARKPRNRPEPTDNQSAVARYLANLYPDGIPEEHWPVVQTVRGLAEAVDNLPELPALWRQYREALSDLDGLHAFEEDTLGEIITRLSAPADDTPD
jgi:hypothetical protein